MLEESSLCFFRLYLYNEPRDEWVRDFPQYFAICPSVIGKSLPTSVFRYRRFLAFCLMGAVFLEYVMGKDGAFSPKVNLMWF